MAAQKRKTKKSVKTIAQFYRALPSSLLSDQSVGVRKGLGMYPAWVKVDPTFTMELLAKIVQVIKSGEDLNEEERAYIRDAFARVLKGLPLARALYLTRKTGKPNEILGRRNIEIHNAVVEAVEGRGLSLNKAYIWVSTLPIAAAKDGDQALSPSAVRRIFEGVRKTVWKGSPPPLNRKILHNTQSRKVQRSRK